MGGCLVSKDGQFSCDFIYAAFKSGNPSILVGFRELKFFCQNEASKAFLSDFKMVRLEITNLKSFFIELQFIERKSIKSSNYQLKIAAIWLIMERTSFPKYLAGRYFAFKSRILSLVLASIFPEYKDAGTTS